MPARKLSRVYIIKLPVTALLQFQICWHPAWASFVVKGTDKMIKPIERFTMFKVSDAEGRKKILDQYKVFKKTAVKVPPKTRPAH